MTEREKALGYLEMLKAEGKLDENAIPELTSMYNLTHEEAMEMLASFKTTEAYAKGANKNIQYFTVLFLVFLLLASAFAFVSFSSTGAKEFSIYFLLFALSAFGTLIVVLKQINERYRLKDRYTWLQNKGLPLLVVAILLYVVILYSNSSREYNVSRDQWVKLPGYVLQDCREVTSRNSNYYELMIAEYFEPFRYSEREHMDQLSVKNLCDILKKGDTISLWVEKNKNPELQSSSNNKVWDIEIKGKNLLDINARNEAVKQAKERNTKRSLIFLGFAILVFVFEQAKRKPGVL